MTLFRHGAGLASSQLVEKGLSFAVILVASRLMGTEGIGEFF